MNFCQATQPRYANFGFQRWNRLMARIGPPGDACYWTQFWVF